MKTTIASLGLAVGLCMLISRPGSAEDWAMKKGPLTTRWSAQVNPAAPWPEYPRPQLVRADWRNLNGVWEYQADAGGGDVVRTGRALANKILVPFAMESALSGVMEHHDRIWYRRSFEVPAAWKGKRVILNFGAVDYESEVYVNGRSVGLHRGGYDPFHYDVTDALKDGGDGPQELVVRVFDPTIEAGQPRGKQTTAPGGIMYTPTTGIWQTVWLEPIAPGGVRDLKITPDVDAGAVGIAVETLGEAADAEIAVTVKDGENVVGTAKGKPGSEIKIAVPDAKLWSPDQPFLYDLEIAVARNGEAVDKVDSYFGMRKIEIGEVDGVKKMLLNGKFVFQLGPLDQGFWPDGIYTPPTENALKYDVQSIKDLGFNMVRKHIKVEPARWYYWTDRLGLLVWQDMPSANSYLGREQPVPKIDAEAFERELTAMVKTLQNVPSIIMWVVFNESQGQHDTERLVSLVKKLDPTRLVNEASGGAYTGSGDVHDVHSYPPPACPPPSATQALVCGEYGGIGFRVPGHMWVNQGSGYTNVTSPEALVDLYAEFIGKLKGFRDEKGLSAAVYTQLTDVMTEINGLLTYDRVPKMDVKQIAKANRFEMPSPVYTFIAPTSEKQSQTWRYTMDTPAPNWYRKDFDDSAWKQGKGGFGTAGTPGVGLVGTTWNTTDVWLRRTFHPGVLTPDQIAKLMVRYYHDEDLEVYINGILAYKVEGYMVGYENRPLTPAARKAIKPSADNILAVHCRQTTGGQYVDAGLVIREKAKD